MHDYLEHEHRQASLPNDEAVEVVDDKNVVVLTTEELTPVMDVSSATLDDVLHVLTKSSDWQQLYEAVVMLRRFVVHHSQVITTKQNEELLRPLALECDSLRSAPSKNALLACAECFEFLPRSTQERALLGGARPEMIDVLLRRSVCEKKFLRDAALIAAQKLATHLAGIPLLVAVARYGTNKNGKLCGSAAKIIALSIESLKALYRALAAFRESKDATARTEATVSFQRLAALLGTKALESGVKDALPGAGQAGAVTRILKDASANTSVTKPRTQVRSLRDRVRTGTVAIN
ncbi:uncharacterized protein PITG_07406 [Phytophthora infestans T30-4]|uniref:CLASP N-terminal domain-containing protein n=1 Tax=Phytophthora infestans (strain T30-4) TaxID=403677 RepID=D0N8B8_PHYIT|nr:uncharacterized protein PITG_07406 [Phytophthora infestans T30-4]EEY53803.1 conserved hypothetical protein [Phytophthora infestans T30-4]|eukprot:XP_002904434.1 conserved hypothetical protein [Phytophthora infestans T30-4]